VRARAEHQFPQQLDKLGLQRFDVILMDLEMPVMGGLETTRRIREIGDPTRTLPIIAMSASAYATDVARCSAAGMNGHIAKPIGREALRTKLDRWLPERRTIIRGKNADSADSPLSKLVAEVGPAAAMHVATIFEAQLVKRLDLFRAHSLDLPAIKTEVHNLAGISSTLGFDELTAIARKVDDKFKLGRPIDELLPQLIARCEGARQVLRTLFADPGRIPGIAGKSGQGAG